MRIVMRVTVVVIGLLGGLSWSAATACVLSDDAAPVEAEQPTGPDAGAAALFGLTALAAARWSGARRVPSSPG